MLLIFVNGLGWTGKLWSKLDFSFITWEFETSSLLILWARTIHSSHTHWIIIRSNGLEVIPKGCVIIGS